ncbi:NADH-ubiquinone oxidoreductase [Purpureocillium lavendulum]|uniref:NADH-ubiquinone oxidoreductase n=1 Tax=Purpureocillium lavendulum TaxID=1247861 RepID=A0AB34FSV2_9HYPO|nr:NADH-ubiquinone oxidoreductase [Purpureocillium lavendulum]
MKYTAAISVLALAATAVAAPADLEARTGGNTPPPPSNCNNNGKQVCCSGLLTCLVQVLGSPCNNGAYCCQTEAPVVSTLSESPSWTCPVLSI